MAIGQQSMRCALKKNRRVCMLQCPLADVKRMLTVPKEEQKGLSGKMLLGVGRPARALKVSKLVLWLAV